MKFTYVISAFAALGLAAAWTDPNPIADIEFAEDMSPAEDLFDDLEERQGGGRPPWTVSFYKDRKCIRLSTALGADVANPCRDISTGSNISYQFEPQENNRVSWIGKIYAQKGCNGRSLRMNKKLQCNRAGFSFQSYSVTRA